MSSAVMAKRNEPKDSLDYYPTPRWATEALLEHWIMTGQHNLKPMADCFCLEPAAGGGHMVDVLADYFAHVAAYDIADPENRGWGGNDFMAWLPVVSQLGDMVPTHNSGYMRERYDWAITNPPFKLAYEFVSRMLATARNVAILARLQWLESKHRHEKLWSLMPPQLILVFSERVHMVKDRLPTAEDGGSATAFAWYVWSRDLDDVSDYSEGCRRTHLDWIAPAKDSQQIEML